MKLDDPITGREPGVIFAEVKLVTSTYQPKFIFALLENIFADVVRLFNGDYPGYRACNTLYHDLDHTLDCFLAMARLLHGAALNAVPLSAKDVELGLIAALMHDTGYIQQAQDREGTGGKYTLFHIDRSIAFMEHYFGQNGFKREDLSHCCNFLKCTGLNVKIGDIDFPSPEHETIGKILGAADLLGQMADSSYLEKLPFLYQEFAEGGVPGFQDELDLLKKTPAFWEFTQQRLAGELGGVADYGRDHFRQRWGIDRNLYVEALEANISYLQFVLNNCASDYRHYLNRRALIQFVRQKAV